MTKAKETAVENANPIGVFSAKSNRVFARAAAKCGNIEIVELAPQFVQIKDKDGEIIAGKFRKVEKVTVKETLTRKEFLAKYIPADQQATQI